jgi:hypothetical protein
MSRTSVSKSIVPEIISTVFPNPDLVWFKFEPSDFLGLALKNHATGDYRATCSASGMSSSTVFTKGTGSLSMTGGSFVDISSVDVRMIEFGLTQSATYCIWFNCTQQVPNGGTNSFFLPFAIQYETKYVVFTIGISNNGGSAMIISRINVGGQYVGVGAGNFVTNTWNHIALVVSNTSSGNWSINLYFNKINISSSTSTGVHQSDLPLSSTSYIGSGAKVFNDTSGHDFVGFVDDFRAYNYGLSAAQVATVYDAL